MGLLRKRTTGEVDSLECPPGFEAHSGFVFYADSADGYDPYEPDLTDVRPGERLEVAAQRQIDEFLHGVLNNVAKYADESRSSML
ncbi:MAG TPA: hypothetical protein VJJ78_04380 [Candidatus Saccharimonadales bacterium]|nr:hypothetical protein [Candidatus Saccharimonadales bacterium]